jgi:hypothetical protein
MSRADLSARLGEDIDLFPFVQNNHRSENMVIDLHILPPLSELLDNGGVSHTMSS